MGRQRRIGTIGGELAISTEQARERTGLGERTLNRLISDKIIKTKQIGPGGPGTKHLVLLDSLHAFMNDPRPYRPSGKTAADRLGSVPETAAPYGGTGAHD
jgi:hypothetical protein